jgi:hypothetical protein
LAVIATAIFRCQIGNYVLLLVSAFYFHGSASRLTSILWCFLIVLFAGGFVWTQYLQRLFPLNPPVLKHQRPRQ